MGSGIDTDLLSDLNSRPTDAVIVFELDLGGTTQKYAETWAAASDGLYEGRVVEAGEITRGISDSSFRLPRDSASITIRDDNSRTLEKIIMGSAVGSISGSAARIKIASRTRAQAKWFTLFDGVIDEFSSPSFLTWQFSLKRDDLPLLGLVKIPTVQEYDWPNAPTDSLGLPMQVVYGKHLSTSTAVTGMVPTIYVDNVSFIYLVSFGLLTSIDTVYVDGVESAAANWSADTSFFLNGRYYTIVDFTSDQGDDAVVTVDCQGITSGGLIQNPATQLEHFLTNFVFGDWANSTTFDSSAWLTTANFPIDETFFGDVETFLSDKQIAKGSRVITAGTRGIDVLNEWTEQFQIPSFWTYDGNIAIRPDDHTEARFDDLEQSHFRQEVSPEPEFRSVEFSTDSLIDEVSIDYIYSTSDNAFQKNLSVKDPSKGHDSKDELLLHWREVSL